MKDELYYLHQTPPELCLRLIDYVPIDREDTVFEPFKGEGNFYNAIRHKTQRTTWSEIEDGVDYKSINGMFDWIITNPPFKLEGKMSFYTLFKELIQKCNKGIALLGNDYCLSAFTPKRLKDLEDMGFHITKIVVCNVKKWRGRYYFIIITRDKGTIEYLEGNY